MRTVKTKRVVEGRKMEMVLTVRTTDHPTTDLALCVSESICEYSRSVGLPGCLNECWKGGEGMDTAACRPTLGERDIILNGMVLTAAIRALCLVRTASPCP